MVNLLILADTPKLAASDFARARVPISSLLRSILTGEIVVFRAVDMPLDRVERAPVTEVPMEFTVSGQGEEAGHRASREFLFDLCNYLKPEPRQWIIIADPAGIALRNIDHLMPPDLPGPYAPPEVDSLWPRVHEGGGGPRDEAGPGLCVVRGEFLPMVLERSKEAWEAEPTAGVEDERRIWSDVVRNLPTGKKAFERGEVVCPRVGALAWRALSPPWLTATLGSSRIRPLRGGR